MNKEEYDNTRVNSQRAEATEIGKQLIIDFIKTIRSRLEIEHPEELDNFDNDLNTRLNSVFFHFIKYILNYEIDLKTNENSAIYIFSETSDGKKLISHNLLTDNKVRVIEEEEFATMVYYKILKEKSLWKKIKSRLF
jgi:hypothetical protein